MVPVDHDRCIEAGPRYVKECAAHVHHHILDALACTEALEILHQTVALAVWQYIQRLMVLWIC